MLWYKAWLETRWRFLVGLLLMLCCAAVVVFEYPSVLRLMQQLPAAALDGEIGRQVDEEVRLSRQFTGFVWSHAFRQDLATVGTFFAAILGVGGLLPRTSGDATLYTLSLPVSRLRLFGVRAATGLAEWLILAMAPALLVSALAPSVGERFGLGPALIHGTCLFVAGALFYSLALQLSTVFGEPWPPLLLVLSLAFALAVAGPLRLLPYRGLFGLMSGETYFRTGRPPWPGLLASALLSIALLGGALSNFRRRDV